MLAAAVALAACGERGPSRAEFARQADAICAPELVALRELRERLDAASGAGDPAAVFTRSATLLREGAGVQRATYDRIEALERPVEGDVSAWIAAGRRQAALADTLADAYRARDDARIAQLTGRVDQQAATTVKAARGLGMRACAERVQE